MNNMQNASFPTSKFELERNNKNMFLNEIENAKKKLKFRRCKFF